MAFLTSWRLSLAADQLRDPSATLETVARRVGYGSAFALSAAFKRVHGVSPQHATRELACVPGVGAEPSAGQTTPYNRSPASPSPGTM